MKNEKDFSEYFLKRNFNSRNKKEKGCSIENFGLHLTIDGYGGSFEKLNNKETVWQVLSVLPEKIGMKKLSEPQVFFAPPLNKKDSGGYSGYVIINESHISCHTFPYRLFVSIDVYTCSKEMDKEFIIDFFKKTFRLKDVEVNFLKRGTRFPSKDLVSFSQSGLALGNKKHLYKAKKLAKNSKISQIV